MQQINYVIYKIFNVLAALCYLKRIEPMIWARNSLNQTTRGIFFDFTHKTTHLGDRLFFFPLILSLIKNSCPVSIHVSDKVTRDMFLAITGNLLNTESSCPTGYLAVFPKPSFLSFRKKHKYFFAIDFNDTNIDEKVSVQLIKSFSSFYGVESVTTLTTSYCHSNKTDVTLPNELYFIFSNYIDSGSFRKFFIDTSKLHRMAIRLKSEGYKIIHVGSIKDKYRDSENYSFVDIDLRGVTTIESLIKIVRSHNVIGAVTYDNFIMHLIGMYGKVAYVLFRGRFLSVNRLHHRQYVDNNFFSRADKFFYL